MLFPSWTKPEKIAAAPTDPDAADAVYVAVRSQDRPHYLQWLIEQNASPEVLCLIAGSVWNHEHREMITYFGRRHTLKLLAEYFPHSSEDLAFMGDGDAVTVYRGQNRHGPAGLSWTTDENIAHWFACRGPGIPIVYQCTAKRSRIVFATNVNDEREIVLRPSHWNHRNRIPADPEKAAIYQNQIHPVN